MMIVNARILIKYKFVDTMLVLSMLMNAGLAGAKLIALKYIKNLLKERSTLQASLRRTRSAEA